MGGRRLTVLLIVLGVGLWVVVPAFVPLTIDNMEAYLAATGGGALLVGLGLGRSNLGREKK